MSRVSLIKRNYDVLSFTEIWLDANTSSSDLSFPLFHILFRRDRPNDAHGGILVFMKSDNFVVERRDLEVNDIKCLRLELRIKGIIILIGTFNRHPNSSSAVLDSIHTSIALAIDSGIRNIVVTGDINLDINKASSSRKIRVFMQNLWYVTNNSQPNALYRDVAVPH